MSTLLKNTLLQVRSPIVQTFRFRGKINIQRPRKPHFERARLMLVTRPILPQLEKKECNKLEYKLSEPEDVNPYEKILAKEVINWLNFSKVIGIYHINSIKQDELFKIRVALHKENVTLKMYGKSIMRQAIEKTKYELLYPIFESKTCILFSTEDKTAQIIKITKKFPQMILLAGIAENRILSKNEFTTYASMSKNQNTAIELISTINKVGQQLVFNLESHQNNLINVLNAHVTQNK